MPGIEVGNKHPRVTVIIPYNRDRGWLHAAIKSVPDWAQLLLSKGSGSWASNFNKAIPFVAGDYVKFLHEDDVLTSNSLINSVRAIEEQDVDFIHGRAVDISEFGDIGTIYTPPEIVTYEMLLEYNPMHGGSLMYRAFLFKELGGFDEKLLHAEEYEFNLRCLYTGYKLGYCGSVLYGYRRHANQKSSVGNPNKCGVEIAEKYKAKSQ